MVRYLMVMRFVLATPLSLFFTVKVFKFFLALGGTGNFYQISRDLGTHISWLYFWFKNFFERKKYFFVQSRHCHFMKVWKGNDHF